MKKAPFLNLAYIRKMASAKKLMGASLCIAIVLASVFFLFYSGYLPLWHRYSFISSSDINEGFLNPAETSGLIIALVFIVLIAIGVGAFRMF